MILLPAPPIAPAIVRAVLTGREIHLLTEDGRPARTVKTDTRELAWSPDGRTLALRTRDAGLSFLRVSDGEPIRAADGIERFAWAPDGRLIAAKKRGGIVALDVGGAETPLLPEGRDPASSPDGARLAYVERGLMIAARDGANPRRLSDGKDAKNPSWSYDARRIAWIEGGHLRLIRREGTAPRDLGRVEGNQAFWSPGSADLLARRREGWAVWSFPTETWTPLNHRGGEPPVWNGPRDLLAVDRGKLLQLRIGEKPLVIETGKIKPIAAADARATYRGTPFPDPFRAAPRPSPGERAWTGRFVGVERDRVEILVESETDPRGETLTFGRPRTQKASFRDDRLRTLPPDSEFRLTVRGDRVVGVALPEENAREPEPVMEPPPTPGRRPLRLIEPDGVSRDEVVVPMIYPMLGKRSAGDTFLDSRGGGTRRHHGSDLMAPKMTPLLAVFDGTVTFGAWGGNAGNALVIRSDDGWSATYLHLNNDTPGTDDGASGLRYAIPADLRPGARVRAGELVAWCGDSGNAETTGAHLHFELRDAEGQAILNPFFSLRSAQRRTEPLYADPDPSLKPRKGEERWEGVVVAVQGEKRALTVELTAAGTPVKRSLAPRRVYLELPEGTLVRDRAERGIEHPFTAIAPGQAIGAVGSIEGAKMRVRLASTQLGAN